jgi:hypothetical protein
MDSLLQKIFTPLSSPNKTALEYPFSFINIPGISQCDSSTEIYYTKDFCRGLLDEKQCDVGAFPTNIIEYYWIHEGVNDGESWYCLCKLDNGLYAFYSARCDYTGFDCMGEMIMSVSHDPSKLFTYGMTEFERSLCMDEKKI